MEHSRIKQVQRRGFTLLELLVVMAIMVLMMGIGVTGWFGVRRGAEMRGALSSVRTTLLLARQHAATKRAKVTVTMNRAVSGDYLSVRAVTYSGASVAHSDVYLPKGIKFTNTASSVSSITFNPIGSVSATGPQEVSVVEISKQKGAAPETRTVVVWPITGVTKVK